MFQRVDPGQLTALIRSAEPTLPQTTAEQRAAVYGDVEALISAGFLSSAVRVGSCSMALRSLLPGDLHVLRARSQGRIDLDWKVRAVAAALWLLGDCVLLGEVPGHDLIRWVAGLGPALVEELFGVVLGIFGRQLEAYETAGVFVYEQRSRELWKMLGAQPWTAAGIPGVERLGSNWTQRWWVAFNQVEDERARLEAHWEGHKLAASAMAPQAVRKIDDRDRGIRDREFERRTRAMDQHYWYRAGVLDRDGYLRGKARWALGGRSAASSKTIEDLEAEHERYVRGEKDEHDRVVEMHMQAAMEQDRRQAAEDQRQLEEEVRAEMEEPDELVVRSATQAQLLPQHRTIFVPDVKVAAGRAYWKRRQEQGKGW